jgi:hypothetical protein
VSPERVRRGRLGERRHVGTCADGTVSLHARRRRVSEER